MAKNEQERFIRRSYFVAFDLRLSSPAKEVWDLLAHYSWASGMPTIEVSVRMMAKDLGMSRSSVNRALDELIDNGHVKADRGAGRKSEYTLVSSLCGGKGYGHRKPRIPSYGTVADEPDYKNVMEISGAILDHLQVIGAATGESDVALLKRLLYEEEDKIMKGKV